LCRSPCLRGLLTAAPLRLYEVRERVAGHVMSPRPPLFAAVPLRLHLTNHPGANADGCLRGLFAAAPLRQSVQGCRAGRPDRLRGLFAAAPLRVDESRQGPAGNPGLRGRVRRGSIAACRTSAATGGPSPSPRPVGPGSIAATCLLLSRAGLGWSPLRHDDAQEWPFAAVVSAARSPRLHCGCPQAVYLRITGGVTAVFSPRLHCGKVSPRNLNCLSSTSPRCSHRGSIAARYRAGYLFPTLLVTAVFSPRLHCGMRSLPPAGILAFSHHGILTAAPLRQERGRGNLWVPNILSPHATWAYSWIRPPSRSRRKTRAFSLIAGGRSRPAGGLWHSVRCGR
jgi:hypothetical protein